MREVKLEEFRSSIRAYEFIYEATSWRMVSPRVYNANEDYEEMIATRTICNTVIAKAVRRNMHNGEVTQKYYVK